MSDSVVLHDLRALLETLGKILNVEFTLLPNGVIHLYIPYDPRGSPIYVISPLGEEVELDLFDGGCMSDFRDADALRATMTWIEDRLREIDRLLRPPTEDERMELIKVRRKLKRKHRCVQEAYELEGIRIDLQYNGERHYREEEFEEKKSAFTEKWGIKRYYEIGWKPI